MIQTGTWHEADDAKQLADLLIIPTHDGEHWDEKARALLSTLLLYVCHKHRDEPELRNLAQVRALAAQDWPGLEATLRDAITLSSISLREEATSVLAMDRSDEMKSIKSTMDKATAIWSVDKPAGIVSLRSDFRFEDLNAGVATVYVMVDHPWLTGFGSRMTSRPLRGMAVRVMLKPLLSSCGQAAPTLVQKAMSPSPSTTCGRMFFGLRFMFVVSRWFFRPRPSRPVGSFRGSQGRADAQRRVRPRAPRGYGWMPCASALRD
jgi:hypothetical protein